MISGVARAIGTKRVILLVEVTILGKRAQGLVDISGEVSVRHLDAAGNGIGTSPARKTGDIDRQIAAQRKKRRIHLVGNDVQGRQVSALGAHISHAHEQVRGDLALYVEIPGLDVGRAPGVCGNGNHSVAAVLTIRRKGSGIGENAGHAIIDLDRPGNRWGTGWRNRLLIEKSQTVLVGKRAFSERFVENTITPAQYRLIVDAVSKAYARAERLLVNILRTLPSVPVGPTSKICVGSKNATGAGIRKLGVNHGKAIEGFTSWDIDVKAQAVIQS